MSLVHVYELEKHCVEKKRDFSHLYGDSLDARQFQRKSWVIVLSFAVAGALEGLEYIDNDSPSDDLEITLSQKYP